MQWTRFPFDRSNSNADLFGVVMGSYHNGRQGSHDFSDILTSESKCSRGAINILPLTLSPVVTHISLGSKGMRSKEIGGHKYFITYETKTFIVLGIKFDNWSISPVKYRLT